METAIARIGQQDERLKRKLEELVGTMELRKRLTEDLEGRKAAP